MVLLALSCFGAHTITSDLNLFGSLFVYRDITANEVRNRHGIISLNDVNADGALSITKADGVGTVHLKHDGTLQLTPEGKLSILPKVLLQSDLDMRSRAPLKLILDPDVHPGDPIGSEVVLDYNVDDFSLSDEGKLGVVPLNITAQGAIRVRQADLELGEHDSKLRVIGLNVSSDFQQTGGVLAIRSESPGRVPFYQVGSGFASNGNFSFDGASTLSVSFVKLTESFTLPDNYAAPVGYVMQAYQAGVGTALDIEPALNGRRIIRARCNPFSVRVNGANQLEVNTGNTMKQDVDGVDVRHDLSIKEDLAFGIGVNLSETDRGLQLLADGLGVRTQTMDPIKSGFDGLYLQLSPDDSCLAKTMTGLEIMVAPDGPLRKELLGLDVAVDGVTIKKDPLIGLSCALRGDIDGDITVTPMGIILCNITATGKIQMIGTVLSLLPDVEESIDKVNDLADTVDQAVDKLDTIPDDLADKLDKLDELADKLGDVAGLVDEAADIAKQIGISVGTSALTSLVTTAITATTMGVLAKSQLQQLLTSKSALAMGCVGVNLGCFTLV